MVDGVRTPYVIELDEQLTVVREYSAAARTEEADDSPAESYEARVAIACARWSVDSIKDNPIPGTDDLRAQFFTERAELHRSYSEIGADCPACKEGDLGHKYKEIMRHTGAFDQFR